MNSSHTETLVAVTMPQMGVSVAEGTIVAWRKEPGDWVEADEPVCDITTDKIDTEIPSPASGRVVEILVEVNETVTVGTPAPRGGEQRSCESGGDGGDRLTGPFARHLSGRATRSG